ncbi:MAG: hypothetical protein IH984_15430 [Planctomycetes bacterium]|nr:hypothetical protein [Planctomycetota bacterium]
MATKSIVLSVFFSLTITANAGSVLYVDDDAPLDGDGLTWDTAFTFLQDALTEAANNGEVLEIRVAQGVYRPDQDAANNQGTDDRFATFQLISSTSLIGGYAGIGAEDPDERNVELYETVFTGALDPEGQCVELNDCCSEHKTPGCECGLCESEVCVWDPACCYIEWDELCVLWADLLCEDNCGAQLAPNSFHIVSLFNSQEQTILDGITISHSIANTPLPQEEQNGGGLLIISSNLTMINCLFSGNYVEENGGAIAIYDNSLLEVIDCVFTANSAERGAAIHTQESTLFITNSIFFDNQANKMGGAVNNQFAQATISDSIFTANEARSGGGVNSFMSDTVLNSVIFEENIIKIYGGGVYNVAGNISLNDCIFNANVGVVNEWSRGAGLATEYSNAIIQNCTFTNNKLVIEIGEYPAYAFGGAIFNLGHALVKEDLFLINCTFTGNEVGNDDADPDDFMGLGGAIANVSGAPTIIACTFTANKANFSGGAIYNQTPFDPTFNDCDFVGNSALHNGGGAVFSYGPNSGQFIDCRFTQNIAASGGATLETYLSAPHYINCEFLDNQSTANDGGAVACWDRAKPNFTNCIFIGNSSNSNGGAVASTYWESNPTLTNCTIANNVALGSGGGVYIGPNGIGSFIDVSATINNAILWNNQDQDGTNESSQIFISDESPEFTATINYSTVQGLTGKLGGIGNIADNPLFVDPDDDNFFLSADSPAIDAAWNNVVPSDIADLDSDENTNEFTPIDLVGNPRFADTPQTPDTGCGTPIIADMGAYEFQGNPIQPLLGDIDGDLAITTADIVLLFASWGSCDVCCLADLNSDSLVDTIDLLILLANWG